IKFDWLAGDSFHVAPGLLGGVDLPPVVFKAGSGIALGTNTDIDNDGVRDLNGTEYETVSDELLVPRFIAQSNDSRPALILVGLSGKNFQTIVNFLIYNDNEEVFSAQYAFDCWDRVPLGSINGAFTDTFLKTTNHALSESFPIGNIETGWFRMDGAVAFSTASSISDPAFMAVHLELLDGSNVSAASLPYGLGAQTNGDLVPQGVIADAN
ncbi:MAG: hypothetical protein SGI72_01295, partial [Planctomycetota bacterium]|nr:hypothetical protein [Planctomycetota bacterium]